ncbi:MAG: hypothetical protein HXY24_11660, partial [Rubrivivax sp.]|nr:hypothetical protein [Rubrivivax sp.]
ALGRLVAAGGKLIVVGPRPERDDPDAPLAALPAAEAWPDELATGDARELWERLRASAPEPHVRVGAYGVEVRSASFEGARVANLCNYLNRPVTVRLPAACEDVLTGQRLSGELELPPLVPLLLRVE